jgi:hypothetical protein
MKKLSEWLNPVREAMITEKSDLQKSYQDYFSAKLQKFGVKSPAELDSEKKKEFFNEITKEWERGKGVKPEVKEKIEKEKAEAEEAEKKEPAADVADMKGDASDKMKDLTKANESEVNEAEIKDAEEFRKFAEVKLKKVHGDKYDQAEADKVIDGLAKDAEKSGDWGAAVGKLNKA